MADNADADEIPDQRSINRFVQVCLGLTVLTGIGALLGAALPKSPTGGPDAPWMAAFLTLIFFLWAAIPAHGFGLLWSLFQYLFSSQRNKYRWPLLYFVAWFATAMVIAVISGLADPFFEHLSERKFRTANQAEVSMHKILQRPGDHSAALRLIAEGADVNLADRDFAMKPLHWATKNSSLEVVRALVNAGADVNSAYARSWDMNKATLVYPTPIDLAAFSAVEALGKIELLLERGAKASPQAMVGACLAGDKAMIEVLQAAGGDPVSAAEGEGLRCLHYAAGRGDVALVESLLAAGADPNQTSKYKGHPFDQAFKNQHMPVLLALARAGGGPRNPKTWIELFAQANDEEFEVLAAARPLAGSLDSAIARDFSRTLMSCELKNIQRLLDAGWLVSDTQRRKLRVPDHCEEREALLEAIGETGAD
ncbi:MAG: ankyrin repeat domain-containing protein [Pseudomonadota bacterium]